MYFADRNEAGRLLAERLAQLDRLARLNSEHVVVLGLPRGGVPVAAVVANALDVPLDVLVVRKLGVPFEPELGMGAIGEHGVRVLNEAVIDSTGTSPRQLSEVEAAERVELARRVRRYRGEQAAIALDGRTVVIVDDGIATGSTARAACLIARAQGAVRVVLAVPIAPRGWTRRLEDVADELVSLDTPDDFFAIGQFYGDFSQTSDQEVSDCLRQASARTGRADPEVLIQAGSARLHGQLTAFPASTGIVLFAHGSGSSRHSPRNSRVATALNRAGFATLLFDLLTEEEELDRANVFDTALLADRLAGATRWVLGHPEALGGGGSLPVGYFGASTGAAAALWAAAEPDLPVKAIVSRGGRPDLAAARLPDVTAPTLLIVGGNDGLVLDLNSQAQAQLRCENQLAVVPGATHLFEEPGALEEVAELAADWFADHLQRSFDA